MITIPTGEFVGLLSDAIPFADSEKGATTHACVLIEWDGSELHTQATDRGYWGHAWWHPKDDPEPGVVAEEQLLTEWGGADDPWQCVIDLANARDIVKNFKLGPKEWGVTLTVDFDGRRLRIARARDDAHSALRQDLQSRPWPVHGPLFPDVTEWLAGREKRRSRATAEVSFSARRLAAFSKVRQRGPIVFGLWGPDGATDISIGDRFIGAIRPSKAADEPKPALAPAAGAEVMF